MTEIIVPVIGDDYKVIVAWGTKPALQKIIRSWGYFTYDLNEMGRGVCLMSASNHPVVLLDHAPDTAEYIGTLAHEVYHAVDHIFDFIAENSRDEMFAHCISAVVRAVMAKVIKPIQIITKESEG
jgi:hypothetical protein